MISDEADCAIEKSGEIFVPAIEIWEKITKKSTFKDFVYEIKNDPRFLIYEPDPDLGFPPGPLIGLRRIIGDKDAVKQTVIDKLDSIITQLSGKEELRDIEQKTKSLKHLIEKAFESKK